MPFAEINGFRMRYLAAAASPAAAPGEARRGGAPVIFLHGLGSNADDWELQVPAFSARYQTISVDLRGHGQSPYRGRLTVPAMAGDVAQLLVQMGGPAHVVGLSLGGAVALALGILFPEQVRSLTLVNTFARYRPAGAGGVGRLARRLWLLAFGSRAALAGFIAAGLFPKPEQAPLRAATVASLSRNARGTYWQALLAIRRFDARPGLGTLRCPTLVVLGDRDTTVPRAAGEALAAGIAGARRVVIADSGHATPIDQPEVFNRVVLDFLRSVDAGAPA